MGCGSKKKGKPKKGGGKKPSRAEFMLGPGAHMAGK